MRFIILVLLSTVILFAAARKKSESLQEEVDICVYGGSSAGIVAAYTAKKLGKSVILIEPGKNLGGLTTGGLGATDIGNKYAVTGLAREFYRRVGTHYGKFEQWTFEPHVASGIYDDMIREVGLKVIRNYRLTGVGKQNGSIQQIIVEDSDKPAAATNKTIRAKMFIDATYEGDLMAKAGVSYTVGREGNAQYGETHNGVHLSEFHQLPDGVDPYKVKGDASSGLLWGIGEDKLAAKGTGDHKVQAYNFRLCLTQDKSNQLPVVQPENYDPAKYELLARILEIDKWETIRSSYKIDTLKDGSRYIHHFGGFLIKDMPNGKTDFNNFGGFSTDMIGANYEYPDGDYNTRKRIWKEHEDYTKGLLYFLGHDERVPGHIREDMLTWGYAKDEFKAEGGFSNQLYVREARRMIGRLVMTQKHCEGDEWVEDGVGMAAYGMDSHNCQRIVVNGMVKNEGDIQKWGFAPYPISYRAITPKAEECKNLLVPVCLSASHIAFGSIRMEPVFMVLGQSAATAAVMAIDAGKDVQSIDVRALQEELRKNPLANGSQPEILIDNDNPDRVTVQGKWNTNRGGYGLNHLTVDASPSSDKRVSYSPVIEKDGTYEVWMYFSNFKILSDQIHVTVTVDDKPEKVIIATNEIKELGLPSGDWVSLGKYRVSRNSRPVVEISGRGTSGKVVADAVIWKPAGS